MGLVAILDIDGTLVDTNYHHTVAWQRAMRRFGTFVAAWRIHRHVGMGGDQLVAAVAGDDFEAEHGDEAREAEGELYDELIGEVEPLPGGPDLVRTLKDLGHTVVLASSAKEHEVEHYIDLLGVREVVDAWTTSADVQATKPEPDLVRAALDKAGDGAGAGGAVMLGDTTWDCEAALRADVQPIGVESGGFSNEELREAGAAQVFASPEELLAHLDESPFQVPVSS